MKDCLFCKIAGGEIKTDYLYQDDQIVAFRDINPKAKIHILIVPKIHIPSVAALSPDQFGIVSNMIKVAQKIAIEQKIKNGYRLVFNSGPDSGQEVDHIHLHLLGGNRLGAIA